MVKYYNKTKNISRNSVTLIEISVFGKKYRVYFQCVFFVFNTWTKNSHACLIYIDFFPVFFNCFFVHIKFIFATRLPLNFPLLSYYFEFFCAIEVKNKSENLNYVKVFRVITHSFGILQLTNAVLG